MCPPWLITREITRKRACTCQTVGWLQLYLASQTAGGVRAQRPLGWVAVGVLQQLGLVE